MALNVYQIVTDRIIAELEKGHIPWKQPWNNVRSGAFNRITKRSYSLLNQMLLSHKGEYASYKQWQDIGGCVRKGEKSEIVVFWKVFQKKETNYITGIEKTKSFPMLRYFNVFHISQVDGVEPLPSDIVLNEIDPVEEAERIFTHYIQEEGIRFEQELNNEAFYSPLRDAIHMPLKEQFNSQAEYYSTLFHETVHSTGHTSRLSRFESGLQKAHFGSESYSKEELVAELGSADLLHRLGIETPESFVNSAAYIQNWLQILKNDSRFVVLAASKAEKAVNYILDEKDNTGDDHE